ncbi:MFS transporter [Kordiimonas sp.]|uniref:MFS transporter n=1 Tax=Kordiimonas sp. TaxID=1970157 RepID=UPI003A8CCF74
MSRTMFLVKPRRRLQFVIYGLPAAALSFPLIPFAVYLPAHYAVELGLGFIAVGIALFVSRLLDVASDPLAGWLSDWTLNRFGSRKPWILAGSLLAAIALHRLCLPETAPSALYLGVWSSLLYVGWTFIMVPYHALGSDISSSTTDNTTIAGYREMFSLMGMLAALSLPLFVDISPLKIIPGIIVPAGAILLIFMMIYVREPTQAAHPMHTGKSTIIAQFKTVLQNPSVKRLCSVWFLASVASAIPAALFPLYVDAVLGGDSDVRNLSIIIYFGAAVASMPIWSAVTRYKSKASVMAFGMTVACIAFPAALFVGEGDQHAFYGICIVTGFALGAEILLAPAILADLISPGKDTQTPSVAATHFALWGIVTKVAFAVAIAVSFSLMELISTSHWLSADLGIAMLYAALPIAFKAPSVGLLRSLASPDSKD